MHKTSNKFSVMGFDHCHEQNNATVKKFRRSNWTDYQSYGIGRWMVADPEVSIIITEFERHTTSHKDKRGGHLHLHQQPSVKLMICKICQIANCGI